MSKVASSLLSYVESNDLFCSEGAGNSRLIWNASFNKDIKNIPDLVSVQNFKTYYDEWKIAGVSTSPVLVENRTFDQICCILPKQKEAAQYQLALSAHHLRVDGVLLAIAENEAGGKRLVKWFKELGLDPNSLSKSKCRIVWANKSQLDEEKISSWILNGSEKKIETEYGDFYTKPGIYGWKKIDLGSKILLENLPEELKGEGADFGCGYGFISKCLLTKMGKIQKILAIDADYDALECCKKNLSEFSSHVDFLWEDLTLPLEKKLDLDWIVMNPPFHEGKDTKINIGQLFIQRSAGSLKNKGVLYMVANSHLPYEKTLESYFTSVEKLSEQDGFKVFKAVR